MVRAILAGHKTQTRRVIKMEVLPCWEINCQTPGAVYFRLKDRPDIGSIRFECPWGDVGDLLWVRETWRCTGGGSWYGIAYKATENDADVRAYIGCERRGCLTVPDRYRAQWEHCVYKTNRSCDWRPSIHMPKWVCRLRLKVNAVRVERVQDITEEDVMAEGIVNSPNETPSCGRKALLIYKWRGLWNSINAKRGYGWDKNPWVWVIEFEKLESVKSA